MNYAESDQTPLASIVIPAHNEEGAIARLLQALTNGGPEAPFEIVVVCNGCDDRTADFARRAAPSATVVEIEKPSKKGALRVGDGLAHVYPRVFIDADVEIGAADVLSLLHPLNAGKFLASAPIRKIPRTYTTMLVRAYYDVWERLPQVREGLFGRGVIALSEEANDRVRALPPVMSDDLVVSEAFTPDERTIVDEAVVVVHPPRTIRDLVRRRVRVATGNAEADNSGLRTAAAKTSAGTLFALARSEPRLILRLPVFAAVTLFARLSARRAIRSGDFQTWQRDESSRR